MTRAEHMKEAEAWSARSAEAEAEAARLRRYGGRTGLASAIPYDTLAENCRALAAEHERRGLGLPQHGGVF